MTIALRGALKSILGGGVPPRHSKSDPVEDKRPYFINLILFTLQTELSNCSKLGMQLEFFPERCWHLKCTPLKYCYNKKPFALFQGVLLKKHPVQDTK